MRQQSLSTCVCTIVAWALATTVHADDILEHLPGDALGVVVVNDLQHASDQLERLVEPFEISIPPLLDLLKISIGLGTGIRDSGNLAIALLQSEESENSIEPMVLLPISDYDAFANAIHADASGEICRVSILGEDVLVGAFGEYALMMNVESQAAMQQQIEREVDPERDRQTVVASYVESLIDWLPKQDVYALVMPAGINQLSLRNKQARQPSIRSGRVLQEQSLWSGLVTPLFRPNQFKWLGNNMVIAAIGVDVDSASNVLVTTQVTMKRSSELARLALSGDPQRGSKLGLSDEPFVVTGGGPLPKDSGRRLADFLYRNERTQAAASGLEALSEELWGKELEAYRLLFAEVSSCSFTMLPGKKGDPLLGNFIGTATVPNADEYLKTLQEIAAIWNEVTQKSTTDIKPEFDVVSTQRGSASVTELVVDVASTARDPNVPAFNWMLEAVFGAEGKLRVKFWQIDKTSLLFGMATDEQMNKAFQQVKTGSAELPDSSDIRTTLDMMNQASQWKVLVRPKGCVEWVSRVANEFLGVAVLSDQSLAIPAIPDSPPAGLACHYSDRTWQLEAAFPAPTWSTLGQYFARLRE